MQVIVCDYCGCITGDTKRLRFTGTSTDHTQRFMSGDVCNQCAVDILRKFLQGIVLPFDIYEKLVEVFEDKEQKFDLSVEPRTELQEIRKYRMDLESPQDAAK